MEAIMTRLKEIDEAAAAITCHTAAKKQTLQEEMQRKTSDFDKELQQKTDEAIRLMKENMDKKIESEIKQLSAVTDASIARQKELFDRDKEKMAGEIFEYVTGSTWQA